MKTESDANTRIHCITLPVDDLQRSLEFYRDGLRLAGTEDVKLEPGGDHIPLLLQDGFYLVLIERSGFKQFTDEAKFEVAPPGVSECILSYFSNSNAGVNELLSRAASHGGRIMTQAREQPWGYSGYLADPDGHFWEIMCNPNLNDTPIPDNDSYGVVTAPGTVRIERLLPGPVEKVWSYLVESDKRGKWLASGDMEQKLGGAVALHFKHSTLTTPDDPTPEKYKDMEAGHEGQVRITQFDAPHRLGMTWMEDDDPSEVVFELTPLGENVRLVLTHRRLASRKDMHSVSSGWHTHLNLLIDHLNNHLPVRPFWKTLIQLQGEYEKRIPQDAV